MTVWARLRDEETGEVTSTTLIFPVVLFMVLLAVQFALGYHAKSVLSAAAQEAARAAQAADARPGDGERVANEFMAANAARLVHDLDVDVADDRDRVHVALAAEVVSIIPGVPLRIHADADGPSERFRTPEER
jgi:hypothetical protein